MSKILLINGPNLNLLGQREPSVYGASTLAQIESDLTQQAQDMSHQLTCFQSNSESAIIEGIHQALTDKVAFIIINPAAYTHTSIAIRDALLATAIPFIEVHLSNIHRRESFRHQSYLSDVALGVMCGFGAQGYSLALLAADKHLSNA